MNTALDLSITGMAIIFFTCLAAIILMGGVTIVWVMVRDLVIDILETVGKE